MQGSPCGLSGTMKPPAWVVGKSSGVTGETPRVELSIYQALCMCQVFVVVLLVVL